MQLRALLFDKDGTFLDFAKTWDAATGSVIAALTEGDEAAARRLAEIVGYDLEASILMPTSAFVGGSVSELAELWAVALGLPADDASFLNRLRELFHEATLHAATPIGEPGRIFAALRSDGYQLGVITNDSEIGAKAQCERLGLSQWFEAIIGYDSGHGRKPEAGQIVAFMERFGYQPGETALIGDTLHDMHAARAAGVLGIGVESGFMSAEQLAPHADYVISDISQLQGLLQTMN
ncbi:phosphatase [Kaistia sp. 32K]|uniref:HAD family hydrolase n=1 Tax=Kaistia sp. 32K TaxID=2795690 RepID=UPI0019151361|nr:HAD family hydrolase [Kaistia sp. 32K]BCP53252.1 phosphatase [Kaistia sp. 32K]